jgi:uncharacterized protein YqcC (DUF446 family)
MIRSAEVALELDAVEAALRAIGGWQTLPPPPAALASTEPFCVDTLNFAQWLQFVFLPRMRASIARRQLPSGPCAIAPMAEQALAGSALGCESLLAPLRELDRLISQA